MPADPDRRRRAFLVPPVLLERALALSALYDRPVGDIYRAALRAVMCRPPTAPVAYPQHAAVLKRKASVTLSPAMLATMRRLEEDYFYRRPGWLLLWGCSADMATFERLLHLAPEDEVAHDELQVRRWTGGQPTWLPTTARAPGVRSRRRTSRA